MTGRNVEKRKMSYINIETDKQIGKYSGKLLVIQSDRKVHR